MSDGTMASRILHTSSKATRSRAEEADVQKTSVKSKRTSLIPAPVSSKSSIPITTSLRSITRKPVQVSAAASISKTKSSATKLPTKASERPMSSYAATDNTKSGMGNSTQISADPLPQRQRLRRKSSLNQQHSAYTKPAVSIDVQNQQVRSESSKDSHTYPKSISELSYSQSSVVPLAPLMAPVPEIVASNSRMQSFITHGPQPPQSPQPPKPSTTPVLRLPAPPFGRSASASTTLSESPGPFSNFSRGSTPTSISSASPAMSHIPRFSTRRASSPTRAHPSTIGRKLFDSSVAGNPATGEALSPVEAPKPASLLASSLNSNDTITKKQSADKKKVLRKSPPQTPPRVSSKTALPPISINTAIVQGPKSEVPTRIKGPQSATSPPVSSIPKLSTSTSQAKLPPPRPSRDGTPTLEGFGRSPVLLNNNISTSEQGNIEQKGKESTKEHNRSFRSTSKSLQTAKQSSAQTSTRRQSIVYSPHLIPREASKPRESSSVRHNIGNQPSSREPSPSITSPSKSFSRFGLFAKKLKSSSETSLTQLSDKTNRKGPAAGTGHEGYGKYSRRGRSSSTSTVASRARSTSTESATAGITRTSGSRKSSFNTNDGRPQLDDFFKDRLEPVIIGGGGQIKENRNSIVGSSQPASSQSSTLSLDSELQPRILYRQDDTWTGSAISMTESNDSVNLNSVTSEVAYPSIPTLAHRRSLHRAQLSGGESAPKLPQPINTKRMATSPGPATYDSALSSAPPTDASGPLTDVSEGHEGNWLRPKAKTLLKAKRSRKWNIFHRGQRSNDSLQTSTLSRQSSNDQPALGIYGLEPTQPMPHYALPDDFDTDQAEPMEDTLRTIEANLNNDEDDYPSEAEPFHFREPSMLLPSPLKFPSQFESFSTTRAEDATGKDFSNVALGRHPRLQHVGRIPQVTPRRERLHKPSPQSFSRPFVRQPDTKDKIEMDAIPTFPAPGSRPKLGLQTQMYSESSLHLPFETARSGPPTNGMLYNLDGEREFLRFSPRKWSEVSTANSSSTMSLAAITATISPPDAVLSDDEVWGEFDDFLDQVTSPLSMSPSPFTPRFPAPDDYLEASDDTIQPAIHTSPSSSATTIETTGSIDGKALPTTHVQKLGYLGPPEVQLQLNSPISLTDIYANYGARTGTAKSNLRDSNLSTISGSQYSSQAPLSRSGSRTSTTSVQQKRVTRAMAEKTQSTSTESLRFSALMTSRWLSFDRVLFSPIQEQLRSTRQDRILVVDGLGNDDWSTYCALTYPEATVHSLSSLTFRPGTGQRNPDDRTAPANHRRHTYTDVTAPFPFVKNWFSAVVFRFPAANTSLAYRHTISECKRVLRPGGFLELSVLDMDMVNMGSKTSHAIRSLKMHMHSVRPDISLSPVSDEILKLLGRKGFENVSRAVVGVPVVEQASSSPTKPTEAQMLGFANTARLSLGDLLAKQAQSQDLHYPSTKAMAKAARWWWSKCYENIGPGQEPSIWTDENLLRECEARETGLKLFVCYAQKPVSPPRRTMSV